MPPVTILKRGGGSSGVIGLRHGASRSASDRDEVNGVSRATSNENMRQKSTVASTATAYAMAKEIEAALERERSRWERIYRHRQEALLRGISSELHDNLGVIVQEAIEKESQSLLTMNKRSGGKEKEKEKENIKVLSAFRKAFSEELLGRIENAVRDVLDVVAETVDEGVDEKLVKPTVHVGSGFGETVKGLKELQKEVKEWKLKVGREKGSHVESREDKEKARISKMLLKAGDFLGEGKVRDAFNVAVGEGYDDKAQVLSFVLSNVLDISDVDPDFVLTQPTVMSKKELMVIMATLASDIEDRISSRLIWMTEAIMAFEDAEDAKQSTDAEGLKKKSESVVERLVQIQKSGKLSTQDAKQCKILLHILRSQMMFDAE